MLLSEARSTLTDSVLHVASTTYSEAQVDRALKFVLEKFLRETGLSIASDTATLTAGTALVNITTDITDFRPEALIRAEIAYETVANLDARRLSA